MEHEHDWGPLQRSRLGGTVHRKCQIEGCKIISILDDDEEELNMTVQCLKGSRYHGIVKNRVYPVLDVFRMGKDFGHQTRIVLQLTDRRLTLYIPSVFNNRLADDKGFNAHNGDPTKNARFKFLGEFEVR